MRKLLEISDLKNDNVSKTSLNKEVRLTPRIVDDRSATGIMAIYYAVKSANQDIVEELLAREPELITQASYRGEVLIPQYTPVHHGIITGSDEIVKGLLSEFKGGYIPSKDGKSVDIMEDIMFKNEFILPEEAKNSIKLESYKRRIQDSYNLCDATALAIAVVKNPLLAEYIMNTQMIMNWGGGMKCFVLFWCSTPHLSLRHLCFLDYTLVEKERQDVLLIDHTWLMPSGFQHQNIAHAEVDQPDILKIILKYEQYSLLK